MFKFIHNSESYDFKIENSSYGIWLILECLSDDIDHKISSFLSYGELKKTGCEDCFNKAAIKLIDRALQIKEIER